MNCRFCGTGLPEGAQFCGECGRPVPAAKAPAAPRTRPVMPAIMFSSEPQSEAVAHPVAIADSEFSCPQCGAPISEDDVFCGECGFVLSSSYLSAPTDDVGDVADVASAAEPVEVEDAGVADTGEITEVSGWVAVASDPGSAIELEPLAAGEPEPVVDAESVEPEPRPDAEAEPVPEPEPQLEPEPELELEPEPDLEPEPYPEPVLEIEPEPVPVAGVPSPKVLRAVPDPFPWGKDPRVPTVDLEATRISAAPLAEERFVLQFSTGESVTVSGAGLVGRNPASQPGEFVDQLVTIFDAGKSVSKTHLEFGQDSGRFWVSDRYSTNGSTVRQPDAEPKRCEPGRRYFVARGTRVDIGEQFFVVS